jgi:hypothetical protein
MIHLVHKYRVVHGILEYVDRSMQAISGDTTTAQDNLAIGVHTQIQLIIFLRT